MTRIWAFIAIITLHLQVASLAGFPLTVGSMVGIPLVIYVIKPKQAPPYALVISAFFVGLLAFNFVVSPRPDSAQQFGRTSLLVLVLLFMFVIVSSTSVRRDLQWTRIALGARDALVVVTILSVLQVALGSVGNEFLFNPWRGAQYLYNYQPHLAFNPIPRAQGFYLEPSYDSFVIGSAYFLVAILGKSSPWVFLTMIAGLAATRSATGMVLILAFIAIQALSGRRHRLIALLGVSAALAVAGSVVFTRLTSIGDTGSSGNYRVLAPLPVLNAILLEHPSGLPLGSIKDVIGGYGLLNGASTGTSLDNGLYVIVYYLGWAGLALVGFLFALAWKGYHSSQQSGLGFASFGAFWAFGSLVFSGGIMSPEYVLVLSLIVSAIRHATSAERILTPPGSPKRIGVGT